MLAIYTNLEGVQFSFHSKQLIIADTHSLIRLAQSGKCLGKMAWWLVF